MANTADYEHGKHALPVEQWLEIDRYALAITQKLQDQIVADYERYEFHQIVHKLQIFCSEDLGGFYLDILKDRLYTAGVDSHARRSAQNALHHITRCLVRLIAPILSFTAEEAWAVLCGREDHSVFVGEWHALPPPSQFQVNMADWQSITVWRARVNKQLEEARSAGLIGSALAAEVDIHAAGRDHDVLARLGDDLRLVLITSRATVHRAANEAEQRIDVAASRHDKCERCWHYREDVGADANYPTLCGRCVSNLYGSGEVRNHA
jgi:isoleucyl-tRNA synthetase